MNLDWNDLRYFVSLVEYETLTATANRLNVEHATVARRIERLEKTLGLRLFNRMNKRYLLTDDGRDLYGEAKKLQVGIREFAQFAKDKRQAVSEVVVSAPPLVAQRFIAPRLNGFYRRFAHIRLVLMSDVSVSKLHHRQADIALRMGEPKQDDLVARRLTNLTYHWVAHKNYLTQTAEQDWQFLGLNFNNTEQTWLMEKLGDKPIRFLCNDFSVMKSAIMQELGVGFLPDCCLNHDELKVVESLPDYAIPLYLVMHEDVRQLERVRAVADFLGELLGDF
ncbi:LysR family transcriptional regulator [Moraxella caviae]|uniref:Gcv operon activator n=1 Tax=Moraxella caviae TaxID=34060 RepID=A0A1T0ABU3_9GAMM|nr:LysR family transcriptional regulator [Moraxella caviae]OOR93184.1 LysR family transcriptional regulator [Moraxella caviae]STZ10455.1 Gcv operon activator [Moraxella caviae]VEW10690.1 Gcv operon activator [Moraxella caviae]